MWTFLGFLFAALMVGLPVLAVVVILRAKRQRDQFLAARNHAAAQLGWVWVPPSPWLTEVAGSIFPNGQAGAMAAGWHRGREICCLDFTYITQSTDGQGRTTTSTHECHLVALNLPVALPPLTLAGGSRIPRLLAGRDLELESPAFNAQFQITCQDDRYASALLHPRAMELMLTHPWMDLHIAGNALISWGQGYWSPPEALARLDILVQFADLIPNFVLRDYGQPVYGSQ